MRKKSVIDYFGSETEAAKALGVTRQAVQQWGEFIPEGRAYKLQVLTKGKLKVIARNYDVIAAGQSAVEA